MNRTFNENGLSLVESLVGLAMISIVAIAVLSYQQMMNKSLVTSRVLYQADMNRRYIAGMLENKDAWAKTVAEPTNTDLDCLRNHTSCTTASGTFKILDPAGNIIYDPTNATNGFDINGVQCNSFSDTVGNDACPFRMEISWTPLCTAPCMDPVVKITATTKYKPASNLKFVILNEKNYGFTLIPKKFSTKFMAHWGLLSHGCPPGYIDTGIRDDADGGHHIKEDTSDGPTTMYCLAGVTSVVWANSCPAGHFDTTIEDDADASHYLSDGSDSGGLLKFCVEGISAVKWDSECEDGWVDMKIFEASEAPPHRITEGGSNPYAVRLCAQ